MNKHLNSYTTVQLCKKAPNPCHFQQDVTGSLMVANNPRIGILGFVLARNVKEYFGDNNEM